MAVDPKVLEARKHPRRTEKTCSGCGKLKPIDDYHLGGSTVDGRASACKRCATRRTARWIDARQIEAEDREPVTEKRCSGCQQTKSADHFHRSRGSSTGLQTYCITCAKLMSRGMSVRQIRVALGLSTKRVRAVMSYRDDT